MTKISIERQGDTYTVILEGHAGFKEAGKDIVCAGISALACTLINCLENLKEKERVEEFEYIEKDGMLKVTFTGDSTELLATLETIEIGFMMMAENYPKNILYEGRK